MRKIYALLSFLIVGFAGYSQYCTSSATSFYDTEIWNVTLNGTGGSINNTTGNQGAGLSGTYSDFTSLSASVAQGLSYQVDITTGDDANGPTFYSRETRVWVDWNQDQDFDDVDEYLGNVPYQGGAPIFGSVPFTVPLAALVGNTRMRVVCVEGTPSNCGTYTYGETEDYTINVLPAPSCLPVSAIMSSNPTITSVDLSWTNGGTEMAWIIEYGLSGFTPGSGTQVPAGSNPFTVNGLNPNTTYDFYVYADCGGGDISYAEGPVTETTPQICPVPTGPNSTPGTISCLMDWTPGGTEVMWDVEYGQNGFTLGNGTQAYGVVNGSDTTVIGLTGSTDYHWYVRAVCDVTAPYDTVSLWVGPESFTTGQICADPSALDTTGGDAFNAGLTWTPGGLETEWNVQWGLTGFPLSGTGSNLITGVTILPEMLTGLTPGETYDYYVQAACGSSQDSLSQWVGPFTWTQPDFCNDPSSGTFSNLTNSSVDFSWISNGSETDWTVEYGIGNFTLGTGTQAATTSTTFNATGLNAGTQYCFYVQANCGSTTDSSSAFVGPFCVTTPPTCPQPTNLNAINITNTAANLIWQSGGSETMWNVEYGYPGFVPGSGQAQGTVAGTTNNPTYVTGLSTAAPYEFYVQAACGGTDTSQWSGPYAFNTLLSNDEPCGAIELIPGDPVSVHQNVGGSDNGEGAIIPGTGSCVGTTVWCDEAIANNPVWFKFTATTAGAIISTDNEVTDDAQSDTEIAIYEVGECGVYTSYTLLGANTDVDFGSFGSKVTLCDLTIGETYYVMVDGWSYNDGFTITPGFQGTFGITVSAAAATADAGTAAPIEVCEGSTTPVDLFNAITGNLTTSGQWYNPSVAPGNEYGNLLDFSTVPVGSYPFFYVDGSVCASDTVQTSVTVIEGPSAGNDGSVTSCNTKDIILVQELGGVVELGGTWIDTDGTGALVNGVFESFGVAAGTYTFTYVVAGSGACPADSATVTVTLTDCLSIEEEAGNELTAFPNPVVDILTISNLDINGSVIIEVLDIQGKVVLADQTSDIKGNYDINMGGIEDGIYVIRITTDEATQEVRVVKQ